MGHLTLVRGTQPALVWMRDPLLGAPNCGALAEIDRSEAFAEVLEAPARDAAPTQIVEILGQLAQPGIEPAPGGAGIGRQPEPVRDRRNPVQGRFLPDDDWNHGAPVIAAAASRSSFGPSTKAAEPLARSTRS